MTRKYPIFIRLILIGFITWPLMSMAAPSVTHQKTKASPNISIAGQITYACALVQHIRVTYGPVASWREKGVGGLGNGASATIEATAVAALLGAVAGAQYRSGHDGSFAAHARKVFMGIQRLNNVEVQKGLDGIATICAKK